MNAQFTIIAISKNCNAFGHREFLFLAPCGTGWRATRSLYAGTRPCGNAHDHLDPADKGVCPDCHGTGSVPDPQPREGDTLEFDPQLGPSSRRFETWECPRTLASVPPKFARKVIDEARSAAQSLES